MKKLVVRKEQLPIEIMSTMGCRTQNGADINAIESYIQNINSVIKDGVLANDYVSAAQKDGRGNIAPTTIILPTLAMQARARAAEWADSVSVDKDDSLIAEEFLKLLDVKIHEAKDNLIDRFNWIASQSPESAKFMYENGVMAGYVPEEGIRSALKHGTLAIGQIGLAETLQILIGKDQTSPEGMKLAKRIEELFKCRCAEFKEKYKLNFGVYYTPKQHWEA